MNTFRFLSVFLLCISHICTFIMANPLHDAAVHGNYEGIKEAIEAGYAINEASASTSETALHYASWSGIYEAVYFLMTMGADPFMRDVVGLSPLHACIIGCQQKLLTIALEQAEQIEDNYCRVIELLIKTNDAGISTLALIDLQGNTPLHYAIHFQQARMVKRLIYNLERVGLDYRNWCNNAGVTPQILAGHRFTTALQCTNLLNG